MKQAIAGGMEQTVINIIDRTMDYLRHDFGDYYFCGGMWYVHFLDVGEKVVRVA